ncbi:hypothetical protein [Roseibium sp.]|uniref:hypothetical protein n=1 Tax=Roseibium sp. TaxID=1936156 RepID=UPI003BA851A7
MNSQRTRASNFPSEIHEIVENTARMLSMPSSDLTECLTNETADEVAQFSNWLRRSNFSGAVLAEIRNDLIRHPNKRLCEIQARFGVLLAA